MHTTYVLTLLAADSASSRLKLVGSIPCSCFLHHCRVSTTTLSSIRRGWIWLGLYIPPFTHPLQTGSWDFCIRAISYKSVWEHSPCLDPGIPEYQLLQNLGWMPSWASLSFDMFFRTLWMWCFLTVRDRKVTSFSEVLTEMIIFFTRIDYFYFLLFNSVEVKHEIVIPLCSFCTPMESYRILRKLITPIQKY